jgi:hypothetical protein
MNQALRTGVHLIQVMSEKQHHNIAPVSTVRRYLSDENNGALKLTKATALRLFSK